MINYIHLGDIFKINGVFNYAHGCNCAGAMGKGIAVQFKKKFPKMYLEYKHMCTNGEFNLGDVFLYNYGKGYVFNLGTQTSWKTKADIKAIEQSLNKMLKIATEQNITKIALPKIGAGLGGLDWRKVEDVIILSSRKYPNVSLFIVENYFK